MSQMLSVDDPWCRHIPTLHRALADPAFLDQMPTLKGHQHPEDAAAAWEPLHYLLTVLLGWRSPGDGLLWWYRAGKPISDSKLLSCVQAHWGQNDLLDYYAAWVWFRQPVANATQDFSPAEMAASSQQNDEEWWRSFKRRIVDGPELNPFFGGSNPLHLGSGHSHSFGHTESDPDISQLHVDPSSRRAVLIVNSLLSWRNDLRLAESRLPPLGDRSWHMEVFDRQIGFLGLYRRSRVTGRWFAGRHSIHMCGNPQDVAA